jgi:N-acetyltransferase
MDILESVDTVLSAPPLPSTTLARCKIFLFTTSSQPPAPITKRAKPSTITKPVERVVACIVVQPIRTGMRVLRDVEVNDGTAQKREDWVVIGDDVEEDPKAGVSSKAVICS